MSCTDRQAAFKAGKRYFSSTYRGRTLAKEGPQVSWRGSGRDHSRQVALPLPPMEEKWKAWSGEQQRPTSSCCWGGARSSTHIGA